MAVEFDYLLCLVCFFFIFIFPLKVTSTSGKFKKLAKRRKFSGLWILFSMEIYFLFLVPFLLLKLFAKISFQVYEKWGKWLRHRYIDHPFLLSTFPSQIFSNCHKFFLSCRKPLYHSPFDRYKLDSLKISLKFDIFLLQDFLCLF